MSQFRAVGMNSKIGKHKVDPTRWKIRRFSL